VKLLLKVVTLSATDRVEPVAIRPKPASAEAWACAVVAPSWNVRQVPAAEVLSTR